MRPTPTPPTRLARFALSARHGPVSRLYGPPGSGKSWAACAAVSEALREPTGPDDPGLVTPPPRVVYVTTPTGHDPAAPRPAHPTDADADADHSITSRLSRLGVPDEILGDRKRFALHVVTFRAALARVLAELAPRRHLVILDDVGTLPDLAPVLFDLCGGWRGSRPPVTHPDHSTATADTSGLVLAAARLGHEVLVVESAARTTSPLRSTYRLPAGAAWPDDAPADRVVTGRSYRVDTHDGGIGLYAERPAHGALLSLWPGAPLPASAVTRPEERGAGWSARLGARPDALLLLRPVGPDPAAPGSLLAETYLASGPGTRSAAS